MLKNTTRDNISPKPGISKAVVAWTWASLGKSSKESPCQSTPLPKRG